MKLLLEYGTDANAKDENGKARLHEAVLRGYFDIVKLLIEHGADVNAKDNEGRTPLRVARTEEVRNLLRKYGRRK